MLIISFSDEIRKNYVRAGSFTFATNFSQIEGYRDSVSVDSDVVIHGHILWARFFTSSGRRCRVGCEFFCLRVSIIEDTTSVYHRLHPIFSQQLVIVRLKFIPLHLSCPTQAPIWILIAICTL